MSNTELEQAMLDNEVAIACADPTGMLTRVNNAFEQLTGYSQQELTKLSYQDITPEKWIVYENQQVIKKVFAEGIARYQKEYITKSGDVIAIEIEVHLLLNEQQQRKGMWAKVWPIEQLTEQP